MAKFLNEDETFLLFGCLPSDFEITIKLMGIGEGGRQQKITYEKAAISACKQNGHCFKPEFRVEPLPIPTLYILYILSCMQNLADSLTSARTHFTMSGVCPFMEMHDGILLSEAARPPLSAGAPHVNNNT